MPPDETPQGQSRAQESFLGQVLASVPKPVLAWFGVIAGSAVTFGFVLVTTGLQGPVNRIMDAYAKRIEVTVGKLETANVDLQKSTEAMGLVVRRLEAIETALKGLSDSTVGLSREVDSLTGLVNDNAERITNLEK